MRAPPQSRLRSISRRFTPSLASLPLKAIFREAALAKAGDQGWFDAAIDYAQNIPVRVIAEMLGEFAGSFYHGFTVTH